MKIALLTCAKEFNKNEDDILLNNTINKKHALLSKQCVWNDPSVNWDAFDKIVIRTPWDYSENFDSFFKFINSPEIRNKIINSSEVINWNINKTYLKDLVRRKISVIETEYVSDWDIPTVIKVIHAIDSEAIVIKPSVSAGGRAVYLLKEKDEESILKVLNEIPKLGELMIQPFKDEVCDGEFSAVTINKKLFHTVIKMPPEKGFKVQAHFGGTEVLYSTNPINQEFCTTVLNAIDYDILYGRIDYIFENGRPKLMELELVEPDLFLRKNPKALNELSEMISKQ